MVYRTNESRVSNELGCLTTYVSFCLSPDRASRTAQYVAIIFDQTSVYLKSFMSFAFTGKGWAMRAFSYCANPSKPSAIAARKDALETDKAKPKSDEFRGSARKWTTKHKPNTPTAPASMFLAPAAAQPAPPTT